MFCYGDIMGISTNRPIDANSLIFGTISKVGSEIFASLSQHISVGKKTLSVEFEADPCFG